MMPLIQTRPRLLLGTRILDVIDAHPLLTLSLVVAGVAAVLAKVVLS